MSEKIEKELKQQGRMVALIAVIIVGYCILDIWSIWDHPGCVTDRAKMRHELLGKAFNVDTLVVSPHTTTTEVVGDDAYWPEEGDLTIDNHIYEDTTDTTDTTNNSHNTWEPLDTTL